MSSIIKLNLQAISDGTMTQARAQAFGKALVIKGQKAYYEGSSVSVEKLISTIATSKLAAERQIILFQEIGAKIAETTPASETAAGIFNFSFSSRKEEETINKTVEATLKTLAEIRNVELRKSAANGLLSITVNKLFQDIFMSAENPKLDREKVKELHQYLAACKYDAVVIEEVFTAMPYDPDLINELKEELKNCIGKKKSFLDQLEKVKYRQEARPEALQVIVEIYQHRYQIYSALETEALARNQNPDYTDGNQVFHKFLKLVQDFFSHTVYKSKSIHLLEDFRSGIKPESNNPLPRHEIVVTLQSCFSLIDRSGPVKSVKEDLDKFKKGLVNFEDNVTALPKDQIGNARISDMISLMVDAFEFDLYLTKEHWGEFEDMLKRLVSKRVSVKPGDLKTCSDKAI